MPALGTAIRATPSWARTRTTRKPNARIAPSASSTRCSFSTVSTSPYAIREDRQALLGLSKKLRSSSRARPDVRLREAEFDQRMPEACFVHRLDSGAVVSQVRDVHAIRDCVEAEFGRQGLQGR